MPGMTCHLILGEGTTERASMRPRLNAGDDMLILVTGVPGSGLQ